MKKNIVVLYLEYQEYFEVSITSVNTSLEKYWLCYASA